MAEHLRLPSSPPISSPGRPPSIARPDWPWARSYSHSSQQSGSPRSSSLQSGWDQRASISSTGSQSNYSASHIVRTTSTPKPPVVSTMPFLPGETTRQWSFIGFEWVVRDVHKLRDFVEGVEPSALEEKGNSQRRSDVDDFEILKQSPMIGDHKFKLEIAPTHSADNIATLSPSTLSLYITSLMLDFAEGDYETHATMMTAIKSQGDRVGERGARPDWVWEFWQNDWVFRRESEVWECPLPSLSSLLEHPRIQETDSLVICVQIHSPVGPSIPQQPSVCYVPRDLLDGLEASLDNANTGDIRFVCLERYAGGESSPTFSTHSNISGSTSPFTSHGVARKRIIYAHSDILIRRSEYFANMLSSSFSEHSMSASSERKLHTIVVEEASFETIYWLLKYCYANWILFKKHDDPRAAVEGVSTGWNAGWLSGHKGEWDWKTFNKTGLNEDIVGDNRSATSAESSIPVSSSVNISANSQSDTSNSTSNVTPNATVTTSNAANLKSTSTSVSGTQRQSLPTSLSSSRATSSATRGLVPSSSNSVGMNMVPSTGPPRSKPISIPSARSFSSSPQYPVSPRSSRGLPAVVGSPDPHPHPTPQPEPASALAIYQVSHRYGMPTLAALALEHIMSTITPQSSFALLLATALWDDLRSLVEDFVIERWDEVNASAEFEHCCDEIAAGEWGQDGAKTMKAIFRRLRSSAT